MTRHLSLVFDWNGTLLDDTQESCDGFNAIRAHYGLAPVTVNDFCAHFDMPIERLYAALGFELEFVRREMANLQNLFHAAYTPLEAQARLRPNVAEILQQATNAGHECLILSNHLEEPIRTHCARLEIDHHISTYLANKDINDQARRLPKQKRLEVYCEEKKRRAEQVVIIGDTPEEIRIARNLACYSIAITGGYAHEGRLRAENPDLIVHDMREIAPFVDSLAAKGAAA